MALRDDEQRQLAEIERRLTEDDPRLAQRLSQLGSQRLPRSIVTFAVILASLFVGLAAVAFGTESGLWPLSVLGFLFAVVLPTVITWRVWLRGMR